MAGAARTRARRRIAHPPSLLQLRSVTHFQGYPYLLSLPPAAQPPSERRWPLILFLHGAAERGAQVENVARQALPKLLSGRPDLSANELAVGADVARQFVVVAPQCPVYDVWNEEQLIRLLEHIRKEYPVDRSRTYLTGLSMGGFAVWALAVRHPGQFAAIAAVCGGGRIADIKTAMRHQPEALRSLAFWVFHGANDRVVPVEESVRMVAALREAGTPDVKLTVYPDVAHDAWTPTYSNPALYAWFLQHSRRSA